jgi:hypothetical protein
VTHTNDIRVTGVIGTRVTAGRVYDVKPVVE